MKYTATLISIITEKVFETEILNFLEQEGAKGYSIFEGGGNGSFHLHHGQHMSLVDEFKIVKIEVIMLDRPKAEQIAHTLMNDYFVEQPGIVSLTETEIFRPQKF